MVKRLTPEVSPLEPQPQAIIQSNHFCDTFFELIHMSLHHISRHSALIQCPDCHFFDLCQPQSAKVASHRLSHSPPMSGYCPSSPTQYSLSHSIISKLLGHGSHSPPISHSSLRVLKLGMADPPDVACLQAILDASRFFRSIEYDIIFDGKCFNKFIL